MKISTKGRYGLRIMLDLALAPKDEYVSIKSIASRQDISEKYMEQIVTILNRAGYVCSIRGAKGGYMLAKDPNEYTVGMILRQMEGSLAPVSCLETGKEDCERCNQCVTVKLWGQLKSAIDGVIDNITLADLVAWDHERNGNKEKSKE